MAKLKPEWIVFSHEYVIDFNQTRAYQVAYPKSGYDAAKSSASTLLTNPNILAYVEDIQKDLAKLSGVTALRNILELKKLAYTNISDFKDGWMTQKDFEELSEDTKAALSEIQYVEKSSQHGDETIVKFKLHDKQKAIEILNKMLGYNAPEKLQVDDISMSEDEKTKRIKALLDKASK